ncbi:MAG: AlbA family DNA-binding domain-containing protein [Bacillota bacterium]
MIWDEFHQKLIEAQQNGDISTTVKEFLSSRIPEGTNLDYKWRFDLTQREYKEKLAKWVAGFANTDGGILMLGVKELDDTGEPDPDSDLSPVLVPERVEVSQHITNIINGLVNPRPDYRVYPIPVEGGHAALIVVPASANKPHVVHSRDNYIVPIRRGTSTVTASRLELDQLYADRLATRTTLEQNAIFQFNRYCPENLKQSPICFIYVLPVGSPESRVSITELREGEAYKSHIRGVPRWGGGYRLPNSNLWQGSSQAGQYDYPDSRKEQPKYRAIAYHNGGIATWTHLGDSRDNASQPHIDPFAYFAALHGTLAPWLSFLTNLGTITTIEGIVMIRNIKSLSPWLGERFSLGGDPLHRFEIDPPPFMFSASTPTASGEIIEICFKLFAEFFYTCGYTIDFSKREDPNFYSSYLEQQML